MMSYWLDKLLGADDDGNNLGKLAPLVIFFVIWLFSAIAKASKKGKEGEEKELPKDQEGHLSLPELPHQPLPGFDKLANKIRDRYIAAREQVKKEAQQGGNEQFRPPAMDPQPKQPPPRRPELMAQKPIAPPMYTQYTQEGPIKGLEQPSMGAPLPVDKPTLQKVEPDIQKVDSLTSENAKVSADVEIIHHQYLSELAEQYATQDGFRKAILNYEILGPPLALREHSQM